MTEKRLKKLPHSRHFARRIIGNLIIGMVILLISVLIGMTGYHHYFKLTWIDSFYNACMILTGMGPIDKAVNNGGKLFASLYAIYSGVAFLTCVAIILSPVVHRFLHKLRLDIEE